ncbi:unnamed protein product, partial [Mesorhabditis belari]|uniref:Solute carrier family 25 member 45 n=1 Tax=Mesorhabditis belari TaxID=2138241 RepID=A0AAF3ELA5_9BILA
MTINDFIAGWLAGGAGIFLGYPLDMVKTRLQVDGQQYRGILHCFGDALKKEGIKGIYKGVTAPCLFAGLQHSLMFTGYATTLHLMHPGEANVDARKDLPILEIMIASVIGSMVQLGPSIPVEVVKTKLQFQSEIYTSNSARYQGPFDCARKLLKTKGIRELYKGGNVMAFRDCFGNLFYLPVYESLHKILRDRGSNTTTAQLISGGCAGSISWLSICPLEVVKSRMQTAETKVSAVQVTKEIWEKDGFRAFYRGGLSMVLRGFPANAVIFLVYEQTLMLLEKNRKEK